MPGIIVGVDGSDHSRLALAWAMREAAHHHVPLTVMTVRPAPVRPATEIYWGIHPSPENSQDLEFTQKAVREFTDRVATRNRRDRAGHHGERDHRGRGGRTRQGLA